jgi:hypothetical protein
MFQEPGVDPPGFRPEPPEPPEPPAYPPAYPPAGTPEHPPEDGRDQPGGWDPPSDDAARASALERELELARQAYAEEARAREAEEAERRLREEELERLRRERADEEFGDFMRKAAADLSSIDPEDAAKLARPIYERLKTEHEARYAELAARLDEQRKALSDRDAAAAGAARDRLIQDFRRRLYAAVPDFERLRHTAAYSRFLDSPHVPGSRITNRAHLDSEVFRGNQGYAVEAIRRFAAGIPRRDLSDIAQVGGSSTGDRAPAPARDGGGRDAYPAIKARVEAKRAGRIRSKAEYRALKQGNGAAPPAR